MSDTSPRDLTLERVNRLTQAVTDLMESHAAQGRVTNRLLSQIDDRLEAVGKELRSLGAEQALLGNRVEEAFARAMHDVFTREGERANRRLDEAEDAR